MTTRESFDKIVSQIGDVWGKYTKVNAQIQASRLEYKKMIEAAEFDSDYLFNLLRKQRQLEVEATALDDVLSVLLKKKVGLMHRLNEEVLQENKVKAEKFDEKAEKMKQEIEALREKYLPEIINCENERDRLYRAPRPFRVERTYSAGSVEGLRKMITEEGLGTVSPAEWHKACDLLDKRDKQVLVLRSVAQALQSFSIKTGSDGEINHLDPGPTHGTPNHPCER